MLVIIVPNYFPANAEGAALGVVNCVSSACYQLNVCSLVESFELLSFPELFFTTVGSWCRGGMALTSQNVPLTISSSCLYPECSARCLKFF